MADTSEVATQDQGTGARRPLPNLEAEPMPFPTTRGEMKNAGYEYLHSKICPCGAKIEMWQTPLGKVTPMNVMQNDDAQAVSHFATCPRVSEFRKKKK